MPMQYTEVRFASFLSGGFTTMAVMNQPSDQSSVGSYCDFTCQLTLDLEAWSASDFLFQETRILTPDQARGFKMTF